MESSHLSHIKDPPVNPVEFFKNIITLMNDSNQIILMNLSTISSEYGVLNRNIVYRGLTDDNEQNIIFVTEKNSQKYADLQDHPIIALSIVFHDPKTLNFYQIRVNGIAQELPAQKISNLWKEEPLYAKIRSKIAKCGEPVLWNTIKVNHDEILQAYRNGTEKLDQTESYTAFKVVPNVFDFYYAEPNSIADRVVYRRKMIENSWIYEHVYA